MDSTEAREVNIPLLRKAVEWAEAEAAKPPELCEWEQGAWVAAASLDDAKAWKGTGWLTSQMDKSPECGTCYCVAGFVVKEIDGPRSVDGLAERAAHLLGIDFIDALSPEGGLFYSENSIEDVRRIAEDLAGERL